MTKPTPHPTPASVLPIPVVDRRKLPLDSLPKPPPTPPLTWMVGTGPVGGLAVDEEAGLVATGNNVGDVQLFDLSTGEERGRFWIDGFVWTLAFSPDHRYLDAAGNNASMWCWELDPRRRLVDGVIPGTQAQNGHPWLSPDGSRLAVMKAGGLAVWDIRGLRQLCQTYPTGSMGESLAFDPSARRIFFAAGRTSHNQIPPADMIRRVNTGLRIMPREQQRSFPLPDELLQRNELWSATDASPLPLPDTLAHYPMRQVAFADDRHLLVVRYRLLESFDIETGDRVGPSIELPELAGHLDVQGDLVVAGGRGWLVVNWRTGELVAGSQPPRNQTKRHPVPMRVCLSPSGTRLAVSFGTGIVELHDLDRCRPSGV